MKTSQITSFKNISEEKKNVFEIKYVNKRHSGGKMCFEAVCSSADITSPLSFLYANDAQSTFGGVRLSDSLVTDG